MATDDRDVIAEIMRATRIAILTYQDDQGRLVSTPMGTQDFEDPGTVWFITEVATDKVRAILANPQVNIAYASDKGWVSLSGTAHLSRDEAKLRELWDVSASMFMSSDVEDANSGLIEVTGDTAQYWESPGKLPMLVKMAKGLMGGKIADDGDAPVVEL